MPRCIVVGVDGNAGSLEAARWGAQECRLRLAPLLVLHATGGGAAPAPAWGHLLDTLRDAWPDVTIRGEVSAYSARDALLDAGHRAALIVLGTNASADVSGSIRGSLAHVLGVHSPVPVVVVARAQTGVMLPRRIVVGVTPTPTGHASLRFALEEAARRHCALTVVTPCSPRAVDDSVMLFSDHATMDLQYVTGDPVTALIEAADGAQLLVLGVHRDSDPVVTRLGALPTAILPRVHCTVALVGSGSPGR